MHSWTVSVAMCELDNAFFSVIGKAMPIERYIITELDSIRQTDRDGHTDTHTHRHTQIHYNNHMTL